MDVKLAVRGDPQQAIKAIGAAGVVALAGADADHFRAVALARQRLALAPLEHGRGLVQRLFLEGAGQRATVLADLAVRVRRIDPADGDPVNIELARLLV